MPLTVGMFFSCLFPFLYFLLDISSLSIRQILDLPDMLFHSSSLLSLTVKISSIFLIDLVPELNIQIASHLPDGPRCPRGTSHLRCENLNPELCCSHQLPSAENGPAGLPAPPSKTLASSLTPFLLSHPIFKPLANPISTTFKIDAEGHHLPSFPQPPPWPQGTVTSLLDHCHGL